MTAAEIRTDGPETARAKTRDRRSASLYRMDMPGHLCPFGLKSRALLTLRGYRIDDNLLTSREEVEAFKSAHGVDTTPQTFIDGERIGGFSDLKRWFGLPVRSKGRTTYVPVAAIFGTTFLMALALVWNLHGALPPAPLLEWFFAFSMVALAIQKLQDIGGFVNGFLGYDLLARRVVPYGYVYPFAELWVGLGMIALIGTGSAAIWLVAPVGIAIGAIGAVSVIKAVYIDRRELTCACVGGGSDVPLGAISLSENVMMVAMGLWMLVSRSAGL
ncbi:MauE/DoxX family redox-associated membrane protein [Salipiger sp.]|uniref:MauE/DoxX family redox-associated membrane protein n=1 Tax=Salipiger sp. TaxID=2078585 RepID=UPI003A97E6DE